MRERCGYTWRTDDRMEASVCVCVNACTSVCARVCVWCVSATTNLGCDAWAIRPVRHVVVGTSRMVSREMITRDRMYSSTVVQIYCVNELSCRDGTFWVLYPVPDPAPNYPQRPKSRGRARDERVPRGKLGESRRMRSDESRIAKSCNEWL